MLILQKYFYLHLFLGLILLYIQNLVPMILFVVLLDLAFLIDFVNKFLLMLFEYPLVNSSLVKCFQLHILF